jgi:hypothetical protein
MGEGFARPLEERNPHPSQRLILAIHSLDGNRNSTSLQLIAVMAAKVHPLRPLTPGPLP